MRREIDHQQLPAGAKHPRRLGDRRGRGLGIMQHLVDDHAVGAASASGSAYMSAWRRLASAIPALSSLTRASRSISDERSTPSAWSARGPSNSIIRPVPVPMSIKCRAAGRPSPPRSPVRPRFRRRGASESNPRPRHGREIARRGLGAVGADRGEAHRVGLEQSAAVGVEPLVEQVDQRRGAFPPVSARNTQLPSLWRSISPESARILTWRETRGWLWPSTWASSPTDNSIDRSKATMRNRDGSARAWNSSATGSVERSASSA